MNVEEKWNAVEDEGYLEASDFVEYCKEEKGGNWEEAFLTWWAASSGRRKKQKEEEEEGGSPKSLWPNPFKKLVRDKTVLSMPPLTLLSNTTSVLSIVW